MTSRSAWERHHAAVERCRRCPRLVAWRERVARDKVRRFAAETYWGRPVPGFGDPLGRLLIVGLAPAAHGANRTGRMFTGDRSGEWLYEALHRFGFASQASSENRSDGMRLTDCYITAACRCAPPDNKPTPEELAACRPFLAWEFEHLDRTRIILGLGKIGFEAALALAAPFDRPTPRFAHGVFAQVSDHVTVVGSYHPSQQNTFTGRLTRPMFHGIFRRIRRLLERP